jgi:hypothetical protein
MSGGRSTKQEPKKVYYIKGGDGWYAGPYVNPPKGCSEVLVYDLKFEGLLDTTQKKHIPKSVRDKDSKPLPSFVKMGKGSELRLMLDGTYYRDAGHWYVGHKFLDDGKLVSVTPYKDMPWLDNQELTPITEKEWLEGNKGYITRSDLLEDNEYQQRKKTGDAPIAF